MMNTTTGRRLEIGLDTFPEVGDKAFCLRTESDTIAGMITKPIFELLCQESETNLKHN